MTATIKTVLVATDGSEDAALAAQVAVSICKETGAALHIVHAWQYVPVAPYPAVMPAETYDMFLESAQAILANTVQRIEDNGGTVAGQHLQLGHPADETVALSQEIAADLIIVGSRGLGAIQGLVLGSVSEGIIHQAQCPVLIMRGGASAWPPQRVVIGDDGSTEALRAATLAAQFAGTLGIGITLVRALHELPRALSNRNDLRDEAIAQAETELRQRAATLSNNAGPAPHVVAAIGDPSAILLGAAASASPALIAVGTRGLGLWQRMRLGSVATKVLHTAQGPVLIVPRLRASGPVSDQ